MVWKIPAKQSRARESLEGSAAIDYDEVVLRWMDHYLKGIDNGVEHEKPVRYFVMGANQWRDSDAWPPPARTTPFFLCPPLAENTSAN